MSPEMFEAFMKAPQYRKYSPTTSYPIEEKRILLETAIKCLYGDITSENYGKIGRLSFSAFSESIIGKTLLAIIGNDVKRAAAVVKTGLDTVTTGFPIEVKSLNENSVSIRMSNNPYPVEYYKSQWEMALELMHKTGTVETHILGEHDYNYIISWKDV